MEKYHVTSFCAPPTIYRFMIQEDFKKYDLGAFKIIVLRLEKHLNRLFSKGFTS